MQRQQNYSQLDTYHQPKSEIITTPSGKMYRLTEVDPAYPQAELSPYEMRMTRDAQRADAARSFSYIVLAIGGVFAGIAALMILGAILAAATRPPAPVVNPNCWIGCSGNSN